VIIVSVLLTIGGIIFFFGNTLTRLECLKDDSPVRHSRRDLWPLF
jgi:hypothetical protein